MASTTPLSLAKVSSKPSTLVKGRLYFMPLNNKNPTKFYTFLAKGTSASSDWCPLGLQPIDVIQGDTQYRACYSFTASYSDTSATYNNYFSLSPVSFDTYSYCGGNENRIYYSTSGTPYTSIYTTSDWETYKSEVTTQSGATPLTTYAQMRYEQEWGAVYTNLRVGYNNGNSGMYNFITFEMFDNNHGSGAPLSGGLYTDGNDVLIGDPDSYGVASLQVLVGLAQTCFRGDTSYITMSDRSKKLIQDVKQGDMVLSYDVGKREYCEAVVLANVKTGISSTFDTYVFENGATIDVYGGEPLVFEVDGVLTIGDVRDLYRSHSEGDDRRWVLTHTDGAKARVIKKYGSVKCEKAIGRYMLVTSNGLFFVNGLLKGNKAGFISDYYRSRHIEVPANIESILSQVNYKLAEFDNGLEDDKVDAEVLRQMELKWGMIHNAKKYLDATDYKGRKFDEGALTEEEWLPIKEKRAEMRSLINEKEEEINILRESLPDSLKSPTWVRDSEVWIECEGVLNDHLEDFREWQENIKSKRLEDIERRKSEFQQKREELMSKRNKNNKESK